MRWLIAASMERGVEGLGFVGLELFDVVHGKYRKIKRYCAWKMLRIRYICKGPSFTEVREEKKLMPHNFFGSGPVLKPATTANQAGRSRARSGETE